jgi:hypothetical protein
LIKSFKIPKYIREAQEFAIAADWWKIWCDYINIEFKTLALIEKDLSQVNILKLSQDSYLPKFYRYKARASKIYRFNEEPNMVQDECNDSKS